MKTAKKIGSKKLLSELINPPTELESEIRILRTKISTLETVIDNIVKRLDSNAISIEETAEAKRLRALREKGAIKYGD